MIRMQRWISLLLVVISLFALPVPTWAATLELTVNAKKSLDVTAERAGHTTGLRIHSLYNEFLLVQQAEIQVERATTTLRTANTTLEKNVRRRISTIDHAQVQALAQQVERTKARYQPLFDRYKTLNMQIKSARLIRNTDLNKLLRTQADLIQMSVQVARHDIRMKEQPLQAAKAEQSRKITELRRILEGLEPLRSQIKSRKDAASAAKTRKSSAWKRLNAHVREADASGTIIALADLLHASQQIVEHRREIERIEQRISTLLRDVSRRVDVS